MTDLQPVYWNDPHNLKRQNDYIAKRIKEVEQDVVITEETKQRLLNILRPWHETFTARLVELNEKV